MNNKQIQLPKPTGEYSVGILTYHFVDKSQKDKYSQDPEHPFRELIAHVYYPSASEGTPAPYISPRVKSHIQERLKEGPFLIGGAGYIDANIVTHKFYNALVSNKEAQYPVIIFSPGFGGPHYIYTSLLEELASHGYIIAAINHTYTSEPIEFPDGRILRASPEWNEFAQNPDKMEKAMNEEVPIWISDIQFVLDQLIAINNSDPQNILTRKLNLNLIGVLGHSFGGSIAVSLCRIDSRCKAGIDLDGPLFGEKQDVGFDKPFMFLFAEPFKLDPSKINPKVSKEYFEKVIKQNEERMNNLYNAITNDVYYITLNGTNHMSFTDLNLIQNISDPNKPAPLEVIYFTRILLVHFFDKYLKESFQSILESVNTYKEGVEIKFRPAR